MPQLTEEKVEALSGIYLSPRYDQAKPTPDFHREVWSRYCLPVTAAATAAPRNHAKTTAFTHDFALAAVLFRWEEYAMILGSSEEMAIEMLSDIADELRDNEDLRRDFGIERFVTDQRSDIIVECSDGYQFRILARGAEQKIRGRKWHGKRPGLIIADDIEDDEQVENRERRLKFRRWFFRAAKQTLRDGGKIRVHGTILHEDSLLSRLMKNKAWASKLYKAHKSFSDFSEILWPEKFSAERLKGIRQEFVNEGDAGGYSQEYLNDPRDSSDRYVTRDQFLPMRPEDWDAFKVVAAGVDFAVSTQDRANRSSITIGGKDLDHVSHVMDQRVGRWDAAGIVEELFSVEEQWHPQAFFVEDGVIWKTLWPFIRAEMQKRDIWINFIPLMSVKDKAARGRAFQKRMKAGAVRFNKSATWYEEYEDEILHFTPGVEAILDDQFDSTTELFRGFEEISPQEGDDATPEEEEFEVESQRLRGGGDGRSAVTGY
jgi:predicted phage terminase large subunit-like protein